MTGNAVELLQVTKSFGTHVAVDQLDLTVPEGTVYGFIGPNGSGKTTTLRMILRIFYPDHGSVRVLGEDRPLYPVYLALVKTVPEGLLSGMTVDASIIVDSRTDVLRLPRAVAQARADGTAQLRVWTGGRVETRTAQVGLRGDVYVEILEGLREGEEVLAE